MFSPYGSLLGDGSEDAAFLKALPLFLVPVSPAFGFAEGHSTKKLGFLFESRILRERASLPTNPSRKLPAIRRGTWFEEQ